jgi:hypothetical protein
MKVEEASYVKRKLSVEGDWDWKLNAGRKVN